MVTKQLGFTVILACAAVALTAASVRAEATFRVLTYNIRTGLGAFDPALHPYKERKREVDLGPVVAAIRSVDADVVALQEVRGEA
ncbi:MAG: hypothetical protein VW338_14590 [Rhodospirillaceae bacterium]